MPFVQGTIPASIFECESFETHIAGSVDNHQLFNAVTLFRSTKQERRVTLLTSNDGLWPGVLELQATLGLHERHNGFVALHLHILDTQNGDGPPLVNHHLEILGLEDVLGWSRNGDGSVGGVEVYHALHTFHWKPVIVFFNRQAVTLLFYRPHLGVTLSGIATDDALVLATSTDDERRLLRATVLRTQEQRFVHIVTSFLQRDGDAALTTGIIGASPFAGLSQGVVDALPLADYNLASIYIECGKQQ